MGTYFCPKKPVTMGAISPSVIEILKKVPNFFQASVLKVVSSHPLLYPTFWAKKGFYQGMTIDTREYPNAQ